MPRLRLAGEADGCWREVAEGTGAVGGSEDGAVDAVVDAVAADIFVYVAALLVAALASDVVVVADRDGRCEAC